MRVVGALLSTLVLALCAGAATAAMSNINVPMWATQWQPEVDQRDTRLGRHCTVWEGRIELADLCASLSHASGVHLEAGATLQHMRVTIYSREQPLNGTMLALADLFDGYWAYRSGQPPLERTYYLFEHSPVPPDEVDDWVAARQRDAERKVTERLRPQIEARLAQCRALLKLRPEEVLAQYEKDDPWLCATVLDPPRRPLLERLCRFDEKQMDVLFGEGAVKQRMGDLEPALQQHLKDWFEGVDLYTPNPDRDRSETVPDESWETTTLALEWRPPWLGVAMYVPGGGMMNTGLMSLKDDSPPSQARQTLTRMGFGHERTQEWEAEDAEWRKTHDGDYPSSQQQMLWAEMIRHPSDADERLKAAVDLPEPADSRRGWSMRELLSGVAERQRIPVVSHFLSNDANRFWLRDDAPKPTTLGELLGAFCKRYPPWTWDFTGGYLVLAGVGYRSDEAGRLPAALREEVIRRMRPGEKVSLDEVAGLFAGLNGKQAETLGTVLATAGIHWPWPRTDALRVYGSMTAEQRERIRRGEPIALGELGGGQNKAVLRGLKRFREFPQEPDLSGAELAATLDRVPDRTAGTPDTTITAAPGLSEGERTFLNLTVRYRLPDSGDVSNRFLWAPLESKVTSAPNVMLGDE